MSKSADDNFLLADIAPDDYLEQAGLLMSNGQFREAITFYEGALAYLERTYGEDQPQLTDCLQDLAQAYEAAARYSDAMRVYLRLLRLTREVTGEISAEPGLLLKLTQMNEKLGRPSDALNYCSQALQAAKECLEQEDPISQHIIERYRHLTALASGAQFGERQDSWQFADPNKKTLPLEEAGFRTADGKAAAIEPSTNQNTGQIIGQDFGINKASPGSLHRYDNAGSALAKSIHDDAPDHEETAFIFEQVDDETGPTEIDGAKQSNVDIYSQIKATRARPSLNSESGFSPAKRARDIAIPVVAIATIIGLMAFFLMHHAPAPNTGNTSENKTFTSTNATQTIEARYKTADGEKELLLDNRHMATFATIDSARQMPYQVINPDWNGLLAAMINSVKEKQLWGEKKQSEFKSQENITYYAADGPEAMVIAKMKRLAGYGQGCFLRTGEYPKIVTSEMSSQFIFASPVDNRELPIAIKAITEPAADEKASLQNGTIATDEPLPQPCLITCYAQMSSTLDAKGEKLKATKFFIRGSDRSAHFLTDSKGKVLVITASDQYLLALDTTEPARQLKSKATKKSEKKNLSTKRSIKPTKEAATLPKKVEEQSSILMGRQIERPTKPTTLWIISDPPCPLVAIHYAVPLLLALFSLFAFISSRLTGVDMKGRAISTGSQTALIAAAILLGLAVVVLFLQCVLFV